MYVVIFRCSSFEESCETNSDFGHWFCWGLSFSTLKNLRLKEDSQIGCILSKKRGQNKNIYHCIALENLWLTHETFELHMNVELEVLTWIVQVSTCKVDERSCKIGKKNCRLTFRQGIWGCNSSLMKSEDLHFFEVRSIIFLQYVLMYRHLELESYILIVHL